MRKDQYEKINPAYQRDQGVTEWEKMKKQSYDSEERLVEYSVRINNGD
jgi:hypothetical protein